MEKTSFCANNKLPSIEIVEKLPFSSCYLLSGGQGIVKDFLPQNQSEPWVS